MLDLRQHYIDIHKYRDASQPEPAPVQPILPPPPIVTTTTQVVLQPSNNIEKPTSDIIDFNKFKEQLTAGFDFKCTRKKCKFKFLTMQQRDHHASCHTEDGSESPFACHDCGIHFKKWLQCCMHKWKVHQMDVGLLKCPLCNFRSQISVKVYRHLQTHGALKNYQCDLCDKRFVKLDQMRTHMQTHATNQEESRWYSPKTCKICQHLFANSKTLSKHIKQVHNKIKPFICKVCGYKAARKATITIHERQHTGERPLQCKVDDCDFRAADPSVLAKHMKKHDNNEQAKSYRCPSKDCNYTTIQTSALKNHIRVKHEDIFQQIQCDQCSFTSVNEKMLALHKLDHKSGLIKCEDSSEASMDKEIKARGTDKMNSIADVSSDCFLPLESTDSITHDPSVYTGGVTIPAHPEDAQFPN